MNHWWNRIFGKTRYEGLPAGLSRLIPRLEAAILDSDRKEGRTELLEQYVLAMEVHAAMSNGPAKYADLEEETDLFVSGWVMDLPFAMARVGLAREAVTLGLAWSQIVEPENFLGDRGEILAEAGFESEAREQVKENLQRFPGDVWVTIKAGDAYLSLKDEREAEAAYRRALAVAKEKEDRNSAQERLVDLLESSGRGSEAAALKAGPPGKTRVGRNAPCPCGSGKKYKKCCLPKDEPPPTFQDVKENADKTWRVKESGGLPVQDCYVNSDWQESGKARIVVLRREEAGRLIAGVYLVDTWCLGVKNAFASADLMVERIEADILRRCYFDRSPVSIGLNAAREIVFGSIAYAENLGFAPHPDFKLASRVLGDDPWEPAHGYRFGGSNGKPLYVAGPDDDADAIIGKLKAKLGPDGFEFIAPLSF
jgi:tetratricopeptide (TPR) repeat protein